MRKESFADLANLTDEEFTAWVEELIASTRGPASVTEFDKLLAGDPEFSALVDRMGYLERAGRENKENSFVGRVFVCTTMNRTAVHNFALVVDQTDATVFFKRIGRIVARESDTQNGTEYPDISQYSSILALARKDCERGRKHIGNSSDERSMLTFRSKGETWREWCGEACYFDHQW